MNRILEKIASSLIKPSHRGLLHKELGVPEGQDIPLSLLERAKQKAKKSHNGKLLKQVDFAENFGKRK